MSPHRGEVQRQNSTRAALGPMLQALLHIFCGAGVCCVELSGPSSYGLALYIPLEKSNLYFQNPELRQI